VRDAVHLFDDVTLAQDMLREELGFGEAAEVLQVNDILVLHLVFDGSGKPNQ
jgi:hypothetical protein